MRKAEVTPLQGDGIVLVLAVPLSGQSFHAARYTLLLLRLNSLHLIRLRAFASRHGLRLDSPPA